MASRIFSVKITGQEKIKSNLTYLRRNFPEWVDAANQETAREIRDEARNNIQQLDAFDTGALYDSIEIRTSAKGLSVSVGSTAKYAPFIEFGTSPHFPPLEPIRAWCRRKGIPEEAAYPIARAISERGTPERPFLYPAYLVGMRSHVDRIRKYTMSALGKLLVG
jgi:HK97 gp10 family phage protein